MTDNFKTILQGLPALTSDQRVTVLNRITALDSMDGGRIAASGIQSSKVDYAELLVLDAIAAVVRIRSGELTGPAAMRRVPQYGSFKEKAAVLITQLKTAKISRTRIRVFLEQAIELLYIDLRDQNIPPTSRTLMMHIHRLPAIIDTSFPGYAAAGLLHWIVQNKR